MNFWGGGGEGRLGQVVNMCTSQGMLVFAQDEVEAHPSDSVDSEIESLVGILVLDSTTDVLFNSDDLPFAQAMSTSFSTSSWSSLHSELSSSDCSSPESNFSQVMPLRTCFKLQLACN